jgi:hypothetical protein
VTIANSTFSDNNASNGDDIYTGGVLSVINTTTFSAVAEPDRMTLEMLNKTQAFLLPILFQEVRL